MENASKALVIAGAILISILLISIGIVLVNSGKGVVETGTKNMNSQKTQVFNAQFTPYAGKKKGSELRSLLNLVKANNATDPEHKVGIFYSGTASDIDSVYDLSPTQTYNVMIHYYGEEHIYVEGDGHTPKAMDNLPNFSNETNKIVSESGYIDYLCVY